MRKNIKPMEVQRYFTNWRMDFAFTLRKVIAKELGYISRGKSDFFAVGGITGKPEIRDMKEEKEDLVRFLKSFVLLSKKFGVGLVGVNNEVVPLSAAVKAAQTLQSSLADRIAYLTDQIGIRRRRRIPNELAFDLARAIQFCSGNADALNVFKKMIEDKSDLHAVVHVAIRDVKRELTVWLKKQSRLRRRIMKSDKINRRAMKGLEASIRKISNEKKRIAQYQNTFSLFGKIRSGNGRWSTHLKENFIRSVLSDGEKKLIKKFSPKAIEWKKALLKEMDKENMETMER